MVLKLQYFRQVAGQHCSGIPPLGFEIDGRMCTIHRSLTFHRTSKIYVKIYVKVFVDTNPRRFYLNYYIIKHALAICLRYICVCYIVDSGCLVHVLRYSRVLLHMPPQGLNL